MKNEAVSILVSHTLEVMAQSEYSVAATDFFSPGEKIEIFRELCSSGDGASRCFFWGGRRGCERCTAVFLPDWYLPDASPRHVLPSDTERTDAFAAYLADKPALLDEIPITELTIRGSGFRDLTHRDYMGSILALGVDRSVIGDIAVLSPNEAIVFVSDRIVPFLLTELTRIGRDAVRVTAQKPIPTLTIPRRYLDMTLIVSSPRLDGIVKAITNLSREASAELVRSGLVELSYLLTDNVSAEVHAGDILSIRGYGKFIIGALIGETKSGRLKILCKKYL